MSKPYVTTHPSGKATHLYASSEDPPNEVLFQMSPKETRDLATMLLGSLVRIEGEEAVQEFLNRTRAQIHAHGAPAVYDPDMIVVTLKNGDPWSMRRSTLRAPDHQGRGGVPPRLWLLQHTVVLQHGRASAPFIAYRVWTDVAPPDARDLSFLGALLEEEAVQQVREKFGIKKAPARP